MAHDRLVQARIVHGRQRCQQFVVRVDEALLRLFPGRSAEIVDGHPVFTVRQLCRIAVQPSQTGAFPGADVLRQLPNRMRAGNRTRRGLFRRHTFE